MPEPVAKRRPMIDLEQFEKRLRQPNATNRAEEDPLAELARLVGGQEDPYKSVFDSRARPSVQGQLEQGRYAGDRWEEAGRADPYAEEPLISGDFAAIEAGLLGEESRHAAASGAGDLEAFDDADDTEHWRYEEEDGSAPAGYRYGDEIRSRRPLYLMAAIIIVGIAGIGASFALKGMVSGPRQIAMIKAASGPAKIKPPVTANPDASNQDASILDRSPQPQPVALADNAEQPVDLSHMPERAPRVITLSGLKTNPVSGAANVPVPPPPAQEQAAAQPRSDVLSIAGLIEPRKVKTVSVRPDGTIIQDDKAPQPETVASIPSQVASHAAAPIAKAATPKSTARISTTPKPAARGPEAARHEAAKLMRVADAQAGAETSGQAKGETFAVQLAAPASEQAARALQLKLIKKYSGEIAGFHPSIHKAVSRDKTVYRIRTVGLSKSEATALCEKVRGGGGACFVARD